MTLTRRQHPEFGTEIRSLIAGRTREDREKAELIVAQLGGLDEAKATGCNHPLEDAMHGSSLSRVRYLRLYTRGHSIRVFFSVFDGTIWMLGLDANKRQTCTAPEFEDRLRRRLREVMAVAQLKCQT